MIKTDFKRFVVQTSVLTALLFAGGFAYVYYANPLWFNFGLVFLLFGYLLFSWGVQYALYFYAQKSLQIFSRAFMAITGIKLIILLILMTLVGFLSPQIFKYFLLELLVLYLIFSFLEIRNVLKFIKPRS